MPGYYADQLTEAMGRGGYDDEGNINEKFMGADNIGPFPNASREAWTHIRKEAMDNYGLTERSEQEEWAKLGPLAEPTPANAKKTGERRT